MKKRLLFLLLVFTLVIGGLLVRVAFLQVVQGEELQKKAYAQQNKGRTISPKRGTIFDRNGRELAISATVDTITCTPSNIKALSTEKKQAMADKLAEILGEDSKAIYAKITKDTRYIIIKKKVDREIGDKVREWVKSENIKGIDIDEDTKRYYPNNNLASHVLGFTNVDNEGISGIESMMDKYLKGTPGKVLSEVDAYNRELPFNTEKRIDPQDGLNVVLTIDETIQYLASKTLDKAISDYKIKRGAVAVVMDPRNGDILAMVSKPDFDLNNPYAAPEGVDTAEWNGRTKEDVAVLQSTVWRNKVISDTFEPGSTFKAITTAAGLEEGVIKPDEMVTDAPLKVKGWPKPIKCWKTTGIHGTETFTEAVYNSCNPVFVQVAQRLGITRFYTYLKAFGFYSKTGVQLSGEANSNFIKNPQEIDMAVNAFGQRFTITPMQLVTAYTAIANNGKLMKPRLVKELTDSEGNIVKKFEPETVRTVISRQTSEKVRGILEGVVSEGTGANAYVKGYRVAGKTGTSQTTEEGVYTASFMAFAPADNPVVCVYVALFDPQGESYYGGQIAAPTAGKLTEEVLNYLQVERRYSEKDLEMMAKDVYVPDVRKMTIEEAAQELKSKGLSYKVEGNGNNKDEIVVDQTPKPDANVPEKSVVILYTYKPDKEVMVSMPDILNKTISEATKTLNDAGLNIKVSGMGVAVNQGLAPGTMVTKGKVIEVKFNNIDNIE